jgi:hypothetical protein
LNFIKSGLAFDNSQADTAYTDRFRHMLHSAAPDLKQPVVFYCTDSECWLSVNAAMRARQLDPRLLVELAPMAVALFALARRSLLDAAVEHSLQWVTVARSIIDHSAMDNNARVAIDFRQKLLQRVKRAVPLFAHSNSG